MPSTTYSSFNDKTEALDVAKAFAGGIHGKTVVVTGVNLKGVGYATAEAFASQSPTHVIITGKSPAKLQESIDALKARYPDVNYRPLQFDLSSQKSVRAAAAELLSWSDVPTIDIVINGAAVMLLPELTLSEDGIELQFATNHIGHFLFTNLIMPKLIKSAEGQPKGTTRVVNVSSLSPTMSRMRWSDMYFQKKNKDLPEAEQPVYALHEAWAEHDPENKSYLPLEGYNQSKVANVLFGIAANKRLYETYGILSLAVHPGILQTELARNAKSATIEAITEMQKNRVFEYKSQGASASTNLVAALDPKLGVSEPANGKENYGSFLVDCQISVIVNPLAESSSEAEKIWDLSEEMVKEKFKW